jgi:putative ABC transport system permease protein
MRPFDLIAFAFMSIVRYRLRTVLLLLAMAIGVAAVILLTALGEGARRYVTGQFSELGSNLLIILPGRNETQGGQPPLLGETPRDLTLDDAIALTRSHHVRRMAPIVIGTAYLSVGSREREVTILGSSAALQAIRHLELTQGRFLPDLDSRRASPVCVIGDKVRQELFGPEPPLGRWLRIGDRRFRVIGLLASKGQSLGEDMDNVAIIPVASAQQLFNRPSLFRILVEVSHRDAMAAAKETIRTLIRARHEGEDDITLLTQNALLGTFERLFFMLTLGVGAIAAISLLVAGILIMNVTLVSVSQRTPEIGLLKALGANPGVIRRIFLTEAGILGLGGACLGLFIGQGGVWLGRILYPTFPLAAPLWAVFSAMVLAVTTGLLFALLPARRAARLDPVQALYGH